MIFGTIEGWDKGMSFCGGQEVSHAIKKYTTEELHEHILNAIKSEFKQFDTSPLYLNEKEVGETLQGLDVRIISKLPEKSYGYDKVIEEFEKSSKNLNITDYLIHWPSFPINELESTWRAFEYLKQKFKINIGVCNFDIFQLKKLMKIAIQQPQINQFECNVFLQNLELIDFCNSNDIEMQSYSSVFRGKSDLKIEDMIGWLLNQNINPIVSSNKKERLEQFINCKKHDKDMSEFNTNTRMLMNPNLYCDWT